MFKILSIISFILGALVYSGVFCPVLSEQVKDWCFYGGMAFALLMGVFIVIGNTIGKK